MQTRAYGLLMVLAMLFVVSSMSLISCTTPCRFECMNSRPPMVLKFPLVAGNSGTFATLDPNLASDPASRTVVSLLYDGLVALDSRLQVEDWAAQKIDVSPDGFTYTFHLRPGLAFANGTPVAAADFAYSINRALDPCLASPLASDLFAIKDAATFAGETCARGQITLNTANGQAGPIITTLLGDALQTPDDHTLVITLAEPAGYFLAALTSAAAVALDATLVGPDPTSEEWLTQLTTGAGSSGMFQVTDMAPNGDKLILRPNAYWWGLAQGKMPYLSEIDLTLFKDASTAYAAYQSGQFHFGIPLPTQLAQAKTHPDFHAVGSLDHHGLTINWFKAPFNNLDARQALCLAVNRDALNSAALGGNVLPGWHVIPSGMPGFNPTATGPDGVASAQGNAAVAQRHWASYQAAAAGTFPPVSYTYDRDDPNALAVAKTLQSQWRQTLGIQVILRGEYHTAWQGDIRDGNYVLAPITIEGAYPDPQQFLSHPFLTTTDAQFPDVPQADVLMHQADAITDAALRLRDYQQAEQLLVDNVVTCPLYQRQLDYQVRPCVHGFALDPMGLVPLDAWANVYIDNTCLNV